MHGGVVSIPPRSTGRQVVELGSTLIAPGAIAVPVRHPDGPVLGILYVAQIGSGNRSTEAVAVLEDIAAMATAQLDDLGVHLAIDDFGAGHSSLTRLRRGRPPPAYAGLSASS